MKRLTLGQTIALTLLLSMASLATSAIALHGWSNYRQALEAADQAARSFSDLLAAQYAHVQADRSHTFEQWAKDSLSHPDILAIAHLNAAGDAAAIYPNRQCYQDAFELSAPRWAEDWRTHMFAAKPKLPITVVRSMIDGAGTNRRGESVAVIVKADRQAITAAVANWKFYVPLLGVGVTGLLLGAFWLRREVLSPLDRMAKVVLSERADSEQFPTEREDQLGQIARILTHMYDDLNSWKKRATALERSIDSRVAAETRNIHLLLKSAKRKLWTDRLTGLGNRHLLDERFAHIFESQQSASRELTLVMLDIDHFKTLNDTLGHQEGDKLLKFVGELIRSNLRPSDLGIRYGGDEFLLILPGVPTRDAARICQRIIKLFAQRTKVCQCSPKPTLSAGVASVLRHRPDTAADLIRMSDEALYAAKRTGKNRVCVLADPVGYPAKLPLAMPA